MDIGRPEFCHAGQRVILRLARCVYDLCKTMSVEDVARPFDLDPKTVRAIDQTLLEEHFGKTDYAGLRVLAIDEIAVRRHCPQARIVFDLFHLVKALYRERSRDRIKAALDDWIAMALTVPHPMMRTFIRRLRVAEEGILNHGLYPIGTSPLEGVNTKIKLLLRRAYGYHHLRPFVPASHRPAAPTCSGSYSIQTSSKRRCP